VERTLLSAALDFCSARTKGLGRAHFGSVTLLWKGTTSVVPLSPLKKSRASAPAGHGRTPTIHAVPSEVVLNEDANMKSPLRREPA